jgi:tetraacyldisaccharide 4'-kinase
MSERARRRERYLDLVSGRARGPAAGLLRLGLAAASLPYRLGVAVRNRLYDAGRRAVARAGVPVVSVGNLTLGGTGKTPAVEYVARLFRARGRRVAVLSRGYGAEGGRNDEALVLEENLPDVPHLQGPDRAALARVAVEELESEVLVLDDGFQHRRLARDLDVVLVDATNPWGFGRLFPRGLLREPKGNLRRAGVVVLTRCDQVGDEARRRLRDEVARLAPGRPVVESVHAPVALVNPGRPAEAGAPVTLLAGRPVAAFCGLGNPEAFRRTLLDLGAAVLDVRLFPDHHAYTRGDIDSLRQWARGLPPDALVVTTQKDLVKVRLAALGGRPLWAVRIALRPTVGQEALDRLLEGVLA